ncbi:MAG: bifunctional riboflavin kinase/FAD synthetase [Actinobacteria bacterium]|nr:bifunctional riboflavin kinase/FAD synthetase [Actinomycetota bacterium]
MKSFAGVDALRDTDLQCAVTIGTFDGVHLGHRALIARCIATAERLGVEAAIVTWDRHPLETLRPDKAPPLLSSPERKIELLGETGADVLWVLPFDHEFSTWPPERFVDVVLVEGLGSKAVVIGDGWRFGHKAAGNVALLEELGSTHGFEVEAMTLAQAEGRNVSSSRTRALITAGEVEEASGLLGRHFDIDGLVVHGDGRGKELGFPTANLDCDHRVARPSLGVYAGRLRVRGSWFSAAISVGVNPTFGGEAGVSPVRIEAYVLDMDQDIYGDSVRLEFWKRLRDELKFDRVEDLIEQMGRDVTATRALVG